MKKYTKTIFFSLLFVILASFALFLNKERIQDVYFEIFSNLSKIEEIVGENLAQAVRERVNAPSSPLRAREESSQAFLTLEGVIKSTNIQREKNGLSPLLQNQLLNNSAKIKVMDMFNKQYFAHDSPEGTGASDLAKIAGYRFIVIGENLALGNFLNDDVLVSAWMDSPGHRENILNPKYTEIGVSVFKGVYEGKSTWMAVQHFGLPLSACPTADISLKQKIDANKAQLDILKMELEIRKNEMDSFENKRSNEYNQKVDEYNNLVDEYNNLARDTKEIISQYNLQIEAFNACAQ